MKEYEASMLDKVSYLKNSGCEQAVFGDIFLEDLKQYREEKLDQAGVSCLFPLWKEDTRSLAEEFISLGFKSILVCVNERFLDKSFCGRVIDEDFLDDLPAGVDPCGENGEFHSFVFDGPLFPGPIRFRKGETVYRTYKAPGQSESSYGFYFCDLIPF
jgi:uncharacterized protein (TIGR00290 family)